jgi:hypothetical protein
LGAVLLQVYSDVLLKVNDADLMQVFNVVLLQVFIATDENKQSKS